MNQIILWDDEFSNSQTFQEYKDMGLGKINDNGSLEINWKTEEEIHKELAIKFEQMDSEGIFCWIQDTIGVEASMKYEIDLNTILTADDPCFMTDEEEMSTLTVGRNYAIQYFGEDEDGKFLVIIDDLNMEHFFYIKKLDRWFLWTLLEQRRNIVTVEQKIKTSKIFDRVNMLNNKYRAGQRIFRDALEEKFEEIKQVDLYSDFYPRILLHDGNTILFNEYTCDLHFSNIYMCNTGVDPKEIAKTNKERIKNLKKLLKLGKKIYKAVLDKDLDIEKFNVYQLIRKMEGK